MNRMKRNPFVVGIAGGTGAGKTTFARRLSQTLASGLTVCVVDLDSYYKDLGLLQRGKREHHNFDHPDSLDLRRFREDLCLLRQGQPIIKPMYDFQTGTRYAGGSVLVAGDVVIAEGLMLFIDESVQELFDLRIFIDTPVDIRLRRRLERDVREHGRTLTDAIEHYTSTTLPVHERFIEPTKTLSHFVVPGWEDTDPALGELSAMIRQVIRREKSASPLSTDDHHVEARLES